MSHAIAIKPTQEIATNPLSDYDWTSIAAGLVVGGAVAAVVRAARPQGLSKGQFVLVGLITAIPSTALVMWAQEKWAR